ncbi:hypothetical protein Mlaev_01473 [Microbacterium laevaniformans]|uniref:Uncharacterized protein n=1 Tax=Microbacterium laevaniformans TaxID=36807 RepID=A0A150HE63_9MICO|nr:hypothetical protein Mlaev_01473 [Microbacterium laevaniformans]
MRVRGTGRRHYAKRPGSCQGACVESAYGIQHEGTKPVVAAAVVATRSLKVRL